jgi:hypothetical protein
MAATKSPRRMPSAASPMLWVPVEQAVTMHMFGPFAPTSMAIWPEAVSGSMLAMKKGLTDFGPRVSRVLMASAMRPGPPTPDPKTTPMSSALSGPIRSPESATACLAAATPKTTFLSVRRMALKSIQSLGSKSLTSPAA